MTTTTTKNRNLKIDFANDYKNEIVNATEPIILDYRLGAPVVHIPAGSKLSDKFTASIDYTIHCKSLLSDGDNNTKLAKSNKTAVYRQHQIPCRLENTPIHFQQQYILDRL